MTVYYNENDPFAARWLRSLIEKRLIPDGTVDERSITDVQPKDLEGFVQCHFFAGIGGWSRALAIAGWADDRPVWTGSCPCQPFSVGGERAGFQDARHLWPAWFGLIKECRPAKIFGEQVKGAISLGWLDATFDDLEAEDYACAAAIIPACSVGSPHLRERLWFVADASDERPQGRVCSEREVVWTDGQASSRGSQHQWDGAILAECSDRKVRRIEPSICPLADGVSERVGRLRAYGNAIVPQVAANFVRSLM